MIFIILDFNFYYSSNSIIYSSPSLASLLKGKLLFSFENDPIRKKNCKKIQFLKKPGQYWAAEIFSFKKPHTLYTEATNSEQKKVLPL